MSDEVLILERDGDDTAPVPVVVAEVEVRRRIIEAAGPDEVVAEGMIAAFGKGRPRSARRGSGASRRVAR